MGRRHTYEINVKPYLYEITFPSILIQPIIENAIQHGLEAKVEGGEITMFAEIEGKSTGIMNIRVNP